MLLFISTKEKSSQEARQRLNSRCGVSCEDFSFVEMTILHNIYYFNGLKFVATKYSVPPEPYVKSLRLDLFCRIDFNPFIARMILENYFEFLNSFKTSSITQVVLEAEVPLEGLIPSLPRISATTVSTRGC